MRGRIRRWLWRVAQRHLAPPAPVLLPEDGHVTVVVCSGGLIVRGRQAEVFLSPERCRALAPTIRWRGESL